MDGTLIGFFASRAEDEGNKRQFPVKDLLAVVWGEGTDVHFSTVLAFWFGSRTFQRVR